MMHDFHFSPGLILAALILLLFGNSCTTNNLQPATEPQGSEYYPIEIGRYIDYDVEERVYATLQDTVLYYQIREEISESFLDIENKVAYKLTRYRRDQSNDPWSVVGVWVVKRTSSALLRTEENQTFVKLIFPIKTKSTWNGNAYNSLGDEEYHIENLGDSSKVGNLGFANTLKVVHNDLCSLVNLDFRNEEYAPNIGLIYKEEWVVDLCTDSCEEDCIALKAQYCSDSITVNRPPIPTEKCILSGKILTLKIIDYGKN